MVTALWHGTWMDEESFKKPCIKEKGTPGGIHKTFYGTWVADFMLRQDAGKFMLQKYLSDNRNPNLKNALFLSIYTTRNVVYLPFKIVYPPSKISDRVFVVMCIFTNGQLDHNTFCGLSNKERMVHRFRLFERQEKISAERNLIPFFEILKNVPCAYSTCYPLREKQEFDQMDSRKTVKPIFF